MNRNIKDMNLQGKVFGSLSVIKKMPEKNKGYDIWECKCVCGNYSYVRTVPLIDGIIQRCSTCSRIKHGMCNTRLYYIWEGFSGRCNNPKNKDYKNYGARGISVCKEWKNFIEFYTWAIEHGYSENLQIDRIDFNGNYEPHNCRWVNSYVQNTNKRNINLVNINNKWFSISELARIYKVSRYIFMKRIYPKIINYYEDIT